MSVRSSPLLLLLSASAPLSAALRLPSLHRNADIKPALQHKRGTFPPSAALAVPALLTPLPALADDGWDKFWYEMNNEPPITLSPFEIHPVGYLIIVLYGSYLAWQVLGPPSEAEKQYAAKVEKEMAVAKAAAVPFLESAASAEGAKVMPSGVVYEELKLGDGDMPNDTEQSVTVHYTGTLADGTKFDSSLDRGEPTTFKVGQVIKGWQEGLSMMKVGGKARLTIPSTMAYGDIAMGNGSAGPNPHMHMHVPCPMCHAHGRSRWAMDQQDRTRMPHVPCPMRHAPCAMPHRPCPICHVHVTFRWTTDWRDRTLPSLSPSASPLSLTLAVHPHPYPHPHPHAHAHAHAHPGKIPAGSALQFEVELLELKEAEKGLFSLPSF